MMNIIQAKIKVRAAQDKDTNNLVDLRSMLLDGKHNKSYTSRNVHESNIWKKSYIKWINEQHGSNGNIKIFVAECEGMLAGCATGIIDNRPPAPDCINGICGWVQSVVVLPQWRRQGVALCIMKNLLRWFEEKTVSKVVLESTYEAEGLYEKLGFTVSPENVFIYEGNRL